jgi:pyruvate dehydrogenase E2 component (dihydrolipoamide acetyltransferase)
VATEVKLPRLGQGMESGTIVKWLKGEGEPVKKREPLYELDTDKVTQEVEAEADGVLLKILVDSGEVEVGRTVAYIGTEDESASGAEAPETDTREDEAAVEEEDEPETEGSSASEMDAERGRGREAAAATAAAEQPATSDRQLEKGEARVKASPLARRLAREKGIDIAQVSGTGPEGRIVAEDVERAALTPAAAPPAAAPTEGDVEELELTSTRKTIARRLTEAWQAPVFQLTVSADMTRALELRERLVARLVEGEAKPTVSDLLTKVCAAALVRHRAVNAHFTGDSIRRFPQAHVGIAVAAPNGLIVPVIRAADRRTIQEVAAARADLVNRARDGKLQRADLEDGTFTISNLGMYGIEQFVAVLNPPQAAILAVGATEQKAVVREGQIEVRPLLTLTLTCDHRAIDGSDGAEFLRTLKELLEEPALAL